MGSDKVQALAWHRKEPHVLLTGGYDQRCVVSDVRGKSDGMLSMPLSADVESCCWDIGNDSCFYASSEDGVVYCFDMRRTKSAMAVVQAHDRATTCVVSALCARGAWSQLRRACSSEEGKPSIERSMRGVEPHRHQLAGNGVGRRDGSPLGRLDGTMRGYVRHSTQRHGVCFGDC